MRKPVRAAAKLASGLILALVLFGTVAVCAAEAGEGLRPTLPVPSSHGQGQAHLPVWPIDAGAEPEAVQVLTLPAVLAKAAAFHPDILKALENLAAAERDLEAQQAAYAPRVSLSGSPGGLVLRQGEVRRGNPSLSISASQSTPVGLNGSASVSLRLEDEWQVTVPSWSVSLTYPLFRSPELNSSNMAIRQAQISLEVAKRNLARTEATALVQTVQLYHAAYRSAVRLAEAWDSLAEAEAEAEAVRRRVEMGMASEVELLTAEAELRRQQLSAVQAERGFGQQMTTLLETVGLSGAEGPFVLAGWLELDTPPDAFLPPQWRELAREFDVALWQRAMAVETAQLQLQAEMERQGVESNVSVGVREGQETQNSPPTTSWSLEVSFSYPLADGGARRRSLEERTRSLEEAEAAYAEEMKAFERRILELENALHDARLNLEIARLTYERTRLEFAGAEAAYASGMSSPQTYRQAQRTLARAYDDLQAALLDVYAAQWNLQIAAGLQPDFQALFAK